MMLHEKHKLLLVYTMIEKMKKTLDNSSYLKIYLYLAVLLVCLVLYLFVFRTASKDSILIKNDTTATASVVANNGSVVVGNTNQEDNENLVNQANQSNVISSDDPITSNINQTSPSTPVQPVTGDNQATKPVTNQVTPTLANPNVLREPALTAPNNLASSVNNKVADVSKAIDAINDPNMPLNEYNQSYVGIEQKSFTIARGETLGQAFRKNDLRVGDLYTMVAVNKLLDNVNPGDKVFYKRAGSKIVVLSLVKKRGGYAGQYVLDPDTQKYKFIRG